MELGVAYGEDLVDDQDVGFEMGRDGEREPQVHARRVPLHRSVEEAFDPRECDDVVESAVDLLRLIPRMAPFR